MKSRVKSSVRLKLAADIISLNLILAFVLREKFLNFHFAANEFVIFLASTGFWLFSASIMKLYDDYTDKPYSIEGVSFVKSLIAYTFVSSTAFYLFESFIVFPKSQLVLHFLLLCFLVPVQKLAIRILKKKYKKDVATRRRVLIVGTESTGIQFYSNYVKNRQYGYELAGFVDDIVSPHLSNHYLGKTADIDKVIAQNELDDIIVTIPITDEKMLERIVVAGEKHGKLIRIIPNFYGLGERKLQFDSVGSLPIINLRSLPLDLIESKLLKRLFDIVFSLFVCVFLLSWLFPIIAVIIKLTSKGPVLFKQERWGLNNKSILCYKFRTMIASSNDVDQNGVYNQASKNDPRITRVGAFLRKTNMDELPQFLNVLFGSMSVVGPRPHPVPLNLQSREIVDSYMLRHWVKPGITGWAQVNGYRGETKKLYLMKKRVEFDVWYIENWTFWLDLQIILQTLVNMVKGEENAY